MGIFLSTFNIRRILFIFVELLLNPIPALNTDRVPRLDISTYGGPLSIDNAEGILTDYPCESNASITDGFHGIGLNVTGLQ